MSPKTRQLTSLGDGPKTRPYKYIKNKLATIIWTKNSITHKEGRATWEKKKNIEKKNKKK
jgi:hypothetical protein